jgi:hypothetical protein
MFALTLAFYVYSLQPSLTWGDGTRLQREAVSGESFILAEMVTADFAPDPFPFARVGVAAWDHPLYVILTHSAVRLLPWVRPLWLVNLFSAVFAAGTVGLVASVIRSHTGSNAAAVIAAGGLAVSHTFWFHAVTPEVYSLLAFMLLLSLMCWDRYALTLAGRWLFAAGVALGLAASDHVLAFLTVPALALYWVLGGRRTRVPLRAVLPGIAMAVAGFGVGFSPFLVQLVRMLRTFSLAEISGPVVGTTFLASLLATSWFDLAKSALTFVVLLSLQFNPAGAWLGVWGLTWGGRVSPRLSRVACAGFGVYGLFGLLYRVSDQFAFFQMAYVFFAVAAGLGSAGVLARLAPAGRRWAVAGLAAGIALMPVLYGAAPGLAQAAGLDDSALGIPQIGTGVRNGLAYYVNPNKRDDFGAETFGRQTLAGLAPNALVLAEWYTDTDEYFILRYYIAVEGLRPDVTVAGWPTVDPFKFDANQAVRLVEAEVGHRPIYLASLSETFYGVSQLKQRYCIVPEQNLYRLYDRAEAPAGATC